MTVLYPQANDGLNPHGPLPGTAFSGSNTPRHGQSSMDENLRYCHDFGGQPSYPIMQPSWEAPGAPPSHHAHGQIPNPEPEEGAKGEEGALIDVKDLYASPNPKCTCCQAWVEERPVQDEADAAKRDAKTRRAMFAINRHLEPHGDEGEWRTKFLTIHSLRIKDTLAVVFKDYPVSYGTDFKLILTPDFIPFHHRWERYLEAEREEKDPETKTHLSLLRTTLEAEMAKDLPRVKNSTSTGIAEFDDLRFIFKPGDTLLSRDDNGTLQGGLLKTATLMKLPDKESSYYNINVQVVSWDGTNFGVLAQSWIIKEYQGSKKLIDLPVFPLSFHPDEEQISRELVARARKIEGLRDIHFKAYSGPAVGSSAWAAGLPNKIRVSDRVIIDTEGFYKLEGRYPQGYFPLEALTSHGPVTPQVFGPQQQFHPMADTMSHPLSVAPNHVKTPVPPLSETECLYCTPYVRGFLLETKQWCQLNVDYVHDIDFAPDLLKKLVLREDEKVLISALLTQNTNMYRFDDFVSGKGKGVVMLLCGPPGTGKTLTAESVSEQLQRPLYRLGINDLGTIVNQVEAKLQKALQRCARWGAVLLVDEADVFLERRSVDSLHRNELVSIFLRLLEYYEGVMLLTTNRSTTIDAAFESRIDLILMYEDLTTSARMQVWKNFLVELKELGVELSDAEVEELAMHDLNGRQIKSAVKTAAMLAASEGKSLGMGHLDLVIDIRKRGAGALNSSI